MVKFASEYFCCKDMISRLHILQARAPGNFWSLSMTRSKFFCLIMVCTKFSWNLMKSIENKWNCVLNTAICIVFAKEFEFPMVGSWFQWKILNFAQNWTFFVSQIWWFFSTRNKETKSKSKFCGPAGGLAPWREHAPPRENSIWLVDDEILFSRRVIL